jgi:SAM-dependent methyltransferase
VATEGQAEWDLRYSGPDLVWGAGPNRFVTEETAALPAGRALDLGTGEGRNAIWLAEHGWQVTAVDFSAAGLDRAARLAAERGVKVEWVQADLLDYQPAPGGCDLVLVAYIHLPAAGLARVFRAAAAAVAPGGTLLVIGHDRDNITRGHGGPQDPDRLYTTAAVTAELDGLAVRRAEQVTRTVRTPEGERTAIDTLVRAERPAPSGPAPASTPPSRT